MSLHVKLLPNTSIPGLLCGDLKFVTQTCVIRIITASDYFYAANEIFLTSYTLRIYD